MRNEDIEGSVPINEGGIRDKEYGCRKKTVVP